MKKTLQPSSIVAIAQLFAEMWIGTSSQTMALIAMGAVKSTKTCFDAPLDGSDFVGCVVLVERVPEIREHFDQIGATVPAFKDILLEWDELIDIYQRTKITCNGGELNRRINELRGDANHRLGLKAF